MTPRQLIPVDRCARAVSATIYRAREAIARADRVSIPQPIDAPRVITSLINGSGIDRSQGTARGISAIALPLRILLVGSVSRIALGVLSHELSLGGHLARHLARDLHRPIELTVKATESTIATNRLALRGLRGFDVVLLALGDRELGERRDAADVQREFNLLLEQLASESTSPQVFVVGLPAAGSAAMSRRGTRGIRQPSYTVALNRAIESATTAASFATWVPFAPCPWADAARDPTRLRSSRTYDRWASLLAPTIGAALRTGSARLANDLGFDLVVPFERRIDLALAV